MSLKKKFLAGLLVAVSAAACAFGAFGCSNSNNNPNNPPEGGDNPNPNPPVIEDPSSSFETGWTNDNDYHWHAATDGSDNVDGKAMHDWVKQSDKSVAASCTAAGHNDYKCSVCNAEKSETVAQLSHVWSDTKTVDATCTTRGYEYKECTNKGCTETTRGKDIPALGHKAEAATCTSASVCTREGCGVTVAPALGHDYVLASQQQATCTEQGKEIYACSHKGCNEGYETVVSAATGHSVVWDNGTRNPVHTANVCYEIVYAGHCEYCEHTEEKSTQVAEHIFSSSIIKEANCTEAGTKSLVCQACEYSATETIKAIEGAHIWDAGTSDGTVTTFHCAANHEHTKQTIVYTEKQAVVPVSTLTQTGEVKLANTTIALDEDVKNTISGNTDVNLSADTLEGDMLADLGIYSGDPVYNLTLEAGGQLISQLGGYVTVTVPYSLAEGDDPNHIIIMYIDGNKLVEMEGTYANGFVTFKTNHFSYYTVTRMTPAERCAKFGHVYTSYTIEPTCLTAGYEFTFCTRCGNGDKINLPAKGHEWDSATEEATCTKAGVRHYGCIREGCDVKYDVVLPALGHDWVATEYKEATCTSEGSATYHCDNCTETYSVKLAQTAHAFKTTVIAATCMEGGHKHNVCLTCGLENDTDHVAALGHQTATKAVAPDCTSDGFTLSYCTVCGEELSKTNVVKATGHNLVNGVCSVCGHGCNHDYIQGERTEVTCTEDGYTVYTCAICKNSYKGDIVKATGHHFGVDECPDCGTPNPAARDYYLNFVDTALSGSVSITLNDLTYKVQTNTYENGELVKTEGLGSLTQLDISVITFGISATGEISGSGYGSAGVTVYSSEDVSETVTVSCKIAVTDGEMYVATRSDKTHYVPSMYITMSLDYVLGSMTNGMLDTATLRDYVRWYNTSVNPVFNNLINTNSDLAADLIKKAVNNLFVRTEVEGGYNYLFDFDAAAKLNETLYTAKVSEVVDKFLFKGAYELIPDFVSIILNLNPETALDYAAKFGLEKEQVCAAIDSFMFLKSGEKFDSAAMLEEYLSANDGALKKTTVADLIIAKSGLEITKEDFVKQTDEQVKAMLEQYKDATIYEAIAPVVGGGATAEALYDMVNGMIYTYVGQALNMLNVSFATDKEGNILSAKVDIDIENMPVGGNGGDVPSDKPVENPDYPYEKESSSRYETVMTFKGGIDFGFGAKVVIDNTLISDIKAAKPVFEKNAVITAYTDTVVIKDDYYEGPLPEKSLHTRSTAMTVHTDSKGNIVKVIRTEEDVNRYVYGTFGNFYYCSESVHIYTYEYDIVNGSMSMITKGYCGAFDAYTFSCVYTSSSQYLYYERTYRLQTDELVSDVIRDRDSYENGSYNSTVTVYYNPETKQFKAKDPHHSDYLKLDESKSKIECGGFYYIYCEDCGYHYESPIYHLGDYDRNVEYKLAEGAKSCEDGVFRLYVCPVCEEVVHSDKINRHETYKVGEIDLTKYGAGANCEHTIDVHSCACGYYLGTLIKDKYYNNYFGNNSESFSPEGYYKYDDKEVFVYTCYVSDCGFSFAFYTDSTKDEHCWASYYQHFVLGVTVDRNSGTVSGGVAYDKFENKSLEYTHGWQHNTVQTRDETENGYVIERKCTDCGLKVSKEEYSVVENAAERTTVTTRINTTYKSDVGDNTEKRVTKFVETDVFDAKGNLLKHVYENSYYNGAMVAENLESRHISTTTYEYGEDGQQLKRTTDGSSYDSNGNLDNTNHAVWEIVWVEGMYHEFITEDYNAYDFYDEKGEPSETPKRWQRTVYDYSAGYCSPVITESTQAGESQPRPGEVYHSPSNEMTSPSTCTQFSTSLCVFCKKEVQGAEPHGHWYYNGKCTECGLENPLEIDGRVVLEDLSYTSTGYYVIGYFNRQSSSYSFSVALVDLDKEDEDNVTYIPNLGYIDSNENAVEINYNRSGTVSIAKYDIKDAAEQLGITNYMIRVTYVPEKFYDEMDYSITIDAHEWTETEATLMTYGEGEPTATEVTIKYCAECGIVHGLGYTKWLVVDIRDGVYTYQVEKNGKVYLLEGYFEFVEAKNGELFIGETYRLVDGYVNGINLDKEVLDGGSLIFNDFGNGVLNGTAFSYYCFSDYEGAIDLESGENGNWLCDGKSVQITVYQYDEETQTETETLYIFELAQ